MKTATKILLIGGGITAGVVLYRRGVNNIQFDVDGLDAGNDGGLVLRIKATNKNRFFGYPVPTLIASVFDEHDNLLGHISNPQMQYIPANQVSYLYALIDPNLQDIATVLLDAITSGGLPHNIIFTGEIQVGPVKIPFDTGVKLPGVGVTKNPEPVVNVITKVSEYLIKVSSPVLYKKNYSVAIEDNILTIQTDESNGAARFKRCFILPKTLDAESVVANYEDGALTVSLPKSQQALEN